MLAYEYAARKLASSDWVLEKRRQIKKMQKADKFTYLDVSIPIFAGAFAGKTFDAYDKVVHYLKVCYARSIFIHDQA